LTALKQISILGCGWLGFPLAKSLIEKGCIIKGSTTTLSKIEIFRKAAIQPFLISLGTNVEGKIDEFLKDSEVLIIDIPPKIRGNRSESFVAKIKALIPFIEKSTIKKVVFISSTSVYTDDNTVVTEKTIPFPETESGKQLLEVEKLLSKNNSFQTTIIRFGGLIGEDRHPVYFLTGRENLENPDGPINLIHRDDCIQIIEKIIEKEIWDETFNAATPFHPSRINYYTDMAMKLKLDLPKFNITQKSHGKTVDATKLIEQLGYVFKKLD
jgi:nucleoside-diphosphate-sugar epimerase